MRTRANDSAYPFVLHEEDYTKGVTKREYFAAMAMQGLLTNEYLSSTERLEEHAVEHADRLIEALNKEK